MEFNRICLRDLNGFKGFQVILILPWKDFLPQWTGIFQADGEFSSSRGGGFAHGKRQCFKSCIMSYFITTVSLSNISS
jgi:hypothetical protein